MWAWAKIPLPWWTPLCSTFPPCKIQNFDPSLKFEEIFVRVPPSIPP